MNNLIVLNVIVLFIVGLSILIRKSAKIANRTLGFGTSQPRIKSIDDIETWVSLEDFAIEGYRYHDAINYPFSV